MLLGPSSINLMCFSAAYYKDTPILILLQSRADERIKVFVIIIRFVAVAVTVAVAVIVFGRRVNF